ncbi:three-prime repair exonuclease 1-like [Mercenaria mercenaria]|uniref:three-prime repair exonuclease 1-like n=1 Tax=Mercenaria mercenaria TaxID=6596 RepID=UPI00234F0236|nr:three-prime repair exonuclease 1-like [Mercenaria mercenaria]
MAKLGVHLEDLAEEHGDIQTFVFLDFETTGLLHEGAKVTEMCLLAVTESDLIETRFPRVTNKLTLCFNPGKSLTPKAMELSGLTIDMLNEQKTMTSQSVDLINAFLSHLQEPVCLLAHYGDKFDFPLLMSELYAINQTDALKEALLCADTWEAFKSLHDLPSAAGSSSSRPEKRKSETSTSYSDTPPLKKSKSLSVGTKGTSKAVNKQATKKAVLKMKKSLQYRLRRSNLKIFTSGSSGKCLKRVT